MISQPYGRFYEAFLSYEAFSCEVLLVDPIHLLANPIH